MMFSRTAVLIAIACVAESDLAPVQTKTAPNGPIVVGGGNTFDTNFNGLFARNNNQFPSTNMAGIPSSYNTYNPYPSYNAYNTGWNNYNAGYGSYNWNANSAYNYGGYNYNNFAPSYNNYNNYNAFNNYNTNYNYNYNGMYPNAPAPYGYFGPLTASTTAKAETHCVKHDLAAAAATQAITPPTHAPATTHTAAAGYNANGFHNYGQYVPGGAFNTGHTAPGAPTPAAGSHTNTGTAYRPPANQMWNIVMGHGGYNGHIPGGGTANDNACQPQSHGPAEVPTVRWMGSSTSIYDGEFVVTNNPAGHIADQGKKQQTDTSSAQGSSQGNQIYTNYIDPYTGQRGLVWSPNNNWGNNGWNGGVSYVGNINGMPSQWDGLSQNNNGYNGWAGGGGAWLTDGSWQFQGAMGR